MSRGGEDQEEGACHAHRSPSGLFILVIWETRPLELAMLSLDLALLVAPGAKEGGGMLEPRCRPSPLLEAVILVMAYLKSNSPLFSMLRLRAGRVLRTSAPKLMSSLGEMAYLVQRGGG